MGENSFNGRTMRVGQEVSRSLIVSIKNEQWFITPRIQHITSSLFILISKRYLKVRYE